MKIAFLKRPNGLQPSGPEEEKKLARFKNGAVLKVEVKEWRNYDFLKRMHALYRTAFDHFCEHGEHNVEYKGQKVEPNYDRFRKDLTILAGHYTTTYNIRGEVRLEAKSISYEECTEEDAKKIYSDVISAAIKHVYKYTKDETSLHDIVERLAKFEQGEW